MEKCQNVIQTDMIRIQVLTALTDLMERTESLANRVWRDLNSKSGLSF